MFVRIGTFAAPASQLDELVALFKERVCDAFSSLEGFLGYDAFVDRASGRFVGISKWTTREALMLSEDTGRRSRLEAEALGARWLGEPQILEMAFEKRR